MPPLRVPGLSAQAKWACALISGDFSLHNPLICAALTESKFLTRSREEWRGFAEKQQYIVPSPMTAVFGRKKSAAQTNVSLDQTQGKKNLLLALYGKDRNRDLSMHTEDNTGPRHYLVIEFDSGSFDQHAAVLNHLKNFLPLALVVFSGGKSLHGWFPCKGLPEDKAREFFDYALALGADPRMWGRSQFARMPDGRRDDGNRRKVMFFNPEAAR